MADAVDAEGIDDRVGDGGGRRDGAASPTPFTPSRFTGEGVTVLSSSKLGRRAALGSA